MLNLSHVAQCGSMTIAEIRGKVSDFGANVPSVLQGGLRDLLLPSGQLFPLNVGLCAQASCKLTFDEVQWLQLKWEPLDTGSITVLAEGQG